MPHGSAHIPLLFEIYLNELFFILKDVDICNFADDATTYICDENLENVLKWLGEILEYWFEKQLYEIELVKGHLIVSGNIELWKNIGKNLI